MHAEHADRTRLNDLPGRVIGCALTVRDTPGVGSTSLQFTNYLKVTGLALCLLLNCGKPRLEIKRLVQGR